MALMIKDTNTTTTGVNTTILNIEDDLYLLPGVLLASTSSIAIRLEAGEVNLNLDGTVIGVGAIEADATVGGNVRVDIGATGNLISTESNSFGFGVTLRGGNNQVVNHGRMTAPEAISLFLRGGNNEVQNFGAITGVTGIQVFFDAANNHIYNAGLISGNGRFDAARHPFEGTGILIQSESSSIFNAVGGRILTTAPDAPAVTAADFAGGLVLRNYGEITSQLGTGVNLELVNAGLSTIKVFNWGTITGGSGAFFGSVSDDVLVNRGTLNGIINTGQGADRLDNRDGTIEDLVLLGAGDDSYHGQGGVVRGTVFGEAGDDTMTGNAGTEDVFDGGGDVDTLNFRLLGAVSVALDNSIEAGGSAFGDTYSNFENVIGSDGGKDLIIGDSNNNLLLGLGGKDTLKGGEGADTLRGGTGADVLVGGNGNDRFSFFSINEFGDKISDFSSAVPGNNDRFTFSKDIGGGLTKGELDPTQLQVRGDKNAQDADDRFIFRTTDKTLWFDDDGTGANPALMVADLQQSATMTSGDIFIF